MVSAPPCTAQHVWAMPLDRSAKKLKLRFLKAQNLRAVYCPSVTNKLPNVVYHQARSLCYSKADKCIFTYLPPGPRGFANTPAPFNEGKVLSYTLVSHTHHANSALHTEALKPFSMLCHAWWCNCNGFCLADENTMVP